jgi:hypothetical protein
LIRERDELISTLAEIKQRDPELVEKLLEKLSAKLTANLGKGFSRQNLQRFRKFYIKFPPEKIRSTLSSISSDRQDTAIRPTPSGKFLPKNRESISSPVHGQEISLEDLARVFPLPWSHYVILIGLSSDEAIRFYHAEALRGGWSVRQLKRQIDSQFYERTALSRNKAAMLKKGQETTSDDIVSVQEEIRDPMVLESPLRRFV